MIANDNKKQKKVIHLESVARISDLSDGLHLCDDLSSVDFIGFQFFPSIAWTDKLHDLMKGFFSYKGCH